MRSTSRELKLRARRILSGNYGTCAGAFLMVFAVFFGIIFSVFFGVQIYLFSHIEAGQMKASGWMVAAGIILYLLFLALFKLTGLGLTRMIMNLSRGREYGLSDIMFALAHHPWRYIGMLLLLALISLLPGIPYLIVFIVGQITEGIPVIWALEVAMYILWIVVQIYLNLRFGMAVMILVDEPQIRCIDALKMSDDMMRGNKGRLLYLCASFLGLVFLSVTSVYIGFLWTGPYMIATFIQFYLERRESQVSPVYGSFEEMEHYQTPYDSVNYQ